MFHKQLTYGTNGKIEEAIAVYERITTNIFTMILGIGWGGTFWNPIVSGYTRLTHSFITFLVLKTGMIGIGMILLYFIFILRNSIAEIKKMVPFDFAIVIAAVVTLAGGILFQPTYKMLGYTMVLLLIVLTIQSAAEYWC